MMLSVMTFFHISSVFERDEKIVVCSSLSKDFRSSDVPVRLNPAENLDERVSILTGDKVFRRFLTQDCFRVEMPRFIGHKL